MTIEEQLAEANAKVTAATTRADAAEAAAATATTRAEAAEANAATVTAEAAELKGKLATVTAEAAELKGKLATAEANAENASKRAAKIVAATGTNPVEATATGDASAESKNNPWITGNLTEQVAITKKDPARAKELERAAANAKK